MPNLLRFPNPVNETAARAVAAMVVVLCATTLLTGQLWLTALLAYGFLARVANGPRFSAFGQLATRVVAPRLPGRLVPGPPKRFAQGIGAVLSVGAAIAHFAFAADDLARVLVAFIIIAASLESILGYCLGCRIFAGLMRVGLIPATACAACNDVGARLAATTSS